jgi:hypothetical protein
MGMKIGRGDRESFYLKGVAMLRNCILLLCVFTSIVTAQSVKDARIYTVTVPAGWIQASTETVDFLAQDLHYTVLPHADQKHEFLYQRSSHDSLFTLPYILVNINDAPRLTARELKRFGTKNFNLDAETNVLWGLRDSALEVIIPTDHGSINVFCYSSKADYHSTREQLVQIVRSIRVHPSSEYKKSFFRDMPFVDYLFHDYHLNGILIALLIAALIVARARSKK